MNRNTILPAVLLLAAGAMVLALSTPAAPDEPALRPLFINLTSGADDTHRASMALVLADNSLAAGREVTLYLNVHGVLLSESSGELRMFKRDTLFSDYIAELIGRGLAVIACPYCMEKNGLTEADLLEGIEVAAGENFYPPLDNGAAVFSY